MLVSCVFQIRGWGPFRSVYDTQLFMHTKLLNNPHVNKMRDIGLPIARNLSALCPASEKPVEIDTAFVDKLGINF